MKKKFAIICGLIIVAVVIILINGFTIGLNGVFFFTTNYYSTPEKAIEKDMPPSQSVEIQQCVDIVELTDNMAVYIGLTTDNKLLVCELYTKSDKYSYIGNYSIYNLDNDIATGGEANFSSSTLYNSKGLKAGSFGYDILFDFNEDTFLPHGAQVKSYGGIGDYDSIVFVYRVIEV